MGHLMLNKIWKRQLLDRKLNCLLNFLLVIRENEIIMLIYII